MNREDWLALLGQLFVVGIKGKTVTDEVKTLIHDYRVGNFILFGRNIGNGEEVLALTSALQEEAKKAGHPSPLLICTDQENGIVQRLKAPATSFPGAMALGAADDEDLAYQIGKATGLELKEVGINWNLAPVADVNNNPENPVINVRSFGESPEKVKALMLAWMKGCQEAGVATTLKHFPGHGDTNVDSHSDLPIIHHSLERLMEVELVPFIEGIKNGADTIMSAHIYFTALEKRPDWPATLSREVMTGLLRDRLGFDGVLTTDCLEMNAIVKTVGAAKGAVHAIKAGVDLAMISHTYEYQVEALEALLEAARSEEVPLEQLQQSHDRIGQLKEKYAQVQAQKKEEKGFTYFGCAEHQELAKRAHRQSVCISGNGLRGASADNAKILAVYPGEKTHLQVEERIYDTKIGEALSQYPVQTDHYRINGSEADVAATIQSLSQLAKDYDHVLLFTLSFQEDAYSRIVSGLTVLANAQVLSLRGPFSLLPLDNHDGAVCVFDDSTYAIHAALDAVFGKSEVTGKMPVTISTKAK
ncbi:MAG: glycoside hydrolase family 3 protein [Tuberibacillus sp.]